MAATTLKSGLEEVERDDDKRLPFLLTKVEIKLLGIAGVRSRDGKVLAMMPHPERTVLRHVASYLPPSDGGKDGGKTGSAAWGDFGPWVRLFKSARRWVG